MKNLIMLGAPGSGKGTQAENISKWYGIPQISTGDIFRSNIKAGTELGISAKTYIDAGRLVPDDITIGLVFDRIAQDDCSEGFILDGFPRTVPQAEALDRRLAESGAAVHAVASIYVPDETIVERLSGRRFCAGCGKTYHIRYSPPETDGVCDKCGGGLAQRSDDSEETIRGRISVYYSETSPLIERYRNKGIYIEVTGHELVEDTTAEMRGALLKFFGT